MKKGLLLFLGVIFGVCTLAQDVPEVAEKQTDTLVVEKKEKQDIVKKGISFGPLPVVAFDADKGFQYGALLNLYDFGDGSNYPHPRQQWYIEASFYTKGTQQYFLSYDTRHLIPEIRMSLAGTVVYDKAMDFYGFNGYQAVYDYENVNHWRKPIKDYNKGKIDNLDGIQPEYMTAFYRLERLATTAKADFVGNIWNKKLFWQASYYFSWYRYSHIDVDKINKGKKEQAKFPDSIKTLYERYIDWGIISEDEKDGGFTSALRLGVMYDTRDFEAAPSRGIWTEGNVTLAPDFFGTTHPYSRYMLTFRHYVPVVKNHLTFAYRLNYQGTIGNYLPYYIMPVFSTIGREYDRDGIGGYRTVRGIMRDRLQGLDVGFLNAEFRWKFARFHLWKQNVYLGLNAFFDGGIVTRNYDNSFRPNVAEGTPEYIKMKDDYDKYVNTANADKFHSAVGAGFRIVINQNFIIAVDYAMPLNKQDGRSSVYVNTGYLF
jgi:outer membrane protein assembly factor BamA